MADEKKDGFTTGQVVAIGAGCLLVGTIGTAAVYEMLVIPNALEVASGTKDASKAAAPK